MKILYWGSMTGLCIAVTVFNLFFTPETAFDLGMLMLLCIALMALYACGFSKSNDN